FSDLYTYDEELNRTKLLKSIASYHLLFWLEMRMFHPTMFVKSEMYKKFKYDIKYKIVSDLKIILQMMKDKRTFIKANLPLASYSLGGTSSSGFKILKEELAMKKDLGASPLFIALSTATKFMVMTYRLVLSKFFT
ncbi:MAG: glycosyltransferase, partial [Patescibacteria group bacterium]|nr:glycosyltransferase [Patescibacteria group bacterium]